MKKTVIKYMDSFFEKYGSRIDHVKKLIYDNDECIA